MRDPDFSHNLEHDRGLGHHIRLRPFDNRDIAPEPWQRRQAIQCVLLIGAAFGLLAAGLADSHLHLLTLCDRWAAGQLARRVGMALRRTLRLPVPMLSYPPRPIADPAHRRRCLRYDLVQDERHRVHRDPFFEGTNVPDLLGARLVGAYTIDNVRRAVPRLKSPELRSWVNLEPLGPWQGDPPEALDHLREATLRAGCLPGLQGPADDRRAARCAALAVAGDALTRTECAERLEVSRPTVYRDARQAPDPALEYAIRLQLNWSLLQNVRRAVAERAPAEHTASKRAALMRAVAPRSEAVRDTTRRRPR
jgi:hypothetical protein